MLQSKNGSWLRGKKSQEEAMESTTLRGGRRLIQEGTVRIVVPATEDGRDEISKARKALVLGTLEEKLGQHRWKNGTSGWERVGLTAIGSAVCASSCGGCWPCRDHKEGQSAAKPKRVSAKSVVPRTTKESKNNEEVKDETDPKKEGGGTKGRVAVKMARAIGLSRGVPWCGTLHTVRKRVVFQSILRTGFSTHTEGSRQEWFWVGQRARGGSSRTPVPRL